MSNSRCETSNIFKILIANVFTTMEINFEYHDVHSSQRLESYAIEKLKGLSNRYQFMVDSDVYFKKENTSDPEKGKVAGIRINVPNDRLFAEANAKEFQHSLNDALKALEHQLAKYKSKLKNH